MLHMMQGHLMAARELIKSGEVAQGRPHLAHPWVEVYPMAEDGLARRNQGDLGERLRAVAEKAGQVDDWGDISEEFQAAWLGIEQAVNGVGDQQGLSAETISKVVLSLTKQAVLEYDEALDGERFVAVHEYQDGQGFVGAARQYLDNHQDTLKRRNNEAWRDASEALDVLRKAWPSPLPPEKPVVEVSKLYADQARLELALAPYLY